MSIIAACAFSTLHQQLPASISQKVSTYQFTPLRAALYLRAFAIANCYQQLDRPHNFLAALAHLTRNASLEVPNSAHQCIEFIYNAIPTKIDASEGKRKSKALKLDLSAINGSDST